MWTCSYRLITRKVVDHNWVYEKQASIFQLCLTWLVIIDISFNLFVCSQGNMSILFYFKAFLYVFCSFSLLPQNCLPLCQYQTNLLHFHITCSSLKNLTWTSCSSTYQLVFIMCRVQVLKLLDFTRLFFIRNEVLNLYCFCDTAIFKSHTVFVFIFCSTCMKVEFDLNVHALLLYFHVLLKCIFTQGKQGPSDIYLSTHGWLRK